MNTYEKAELTYIGTAEEMILGMLSVGYDPDGTTYPDFLDFAETPVGDN